MSFGALSNLWLLLLVPAVVAFLVWGFRQRERALARFASRGLRDKLMQGVSQPRRRFKAILLVGAVTAIALACLQPRLGYHWEEVSSRGVDLFIALDVSKSMLAEDASPNRLQLAKRKIIDLMRVMPGDRIGLIAFAGKSFVQCPLTLDYGSVEIFLRSLSPDSISTPGTNVGEAIDQAFAQGNDKKEEHALLILSDGENLEGDPMGAARRAKDRGVKIYAIGIGKGSGAPIPNPEGGFKKDRAGEMVLTRLDEKALQQVALESGGSYVRAVTGDADLEQIASDIHRVLNDKELKNGRRKKSHERFQWPLFLSVFLLLWEFLLRDRSSRRTLAILFLFLILSPAASQGGPAFSEAKQGEEAYHQGKYDEAVQHFLKAQVDDPTNTKLRYDLANSYYKAGKYDEAEKIFSSQKDGDPSMKQNSLYNLGNTMFKKGKLEDAVKNYEDALKINPQDKDASYNLEMAKKKLQEKKDPPKDNKDDKKDQNKKDQDKNQDQQKQNQEQSKSGDKDKEKPSESPNPKAGEDKKKENQKAGEKEDQKKPENKGEQEKPKDSDGKDSGKAAGTKGEMSKEDADRLLSRLRDSEQGKVDKKTKKENSSYETEKDW